MMYNLTYENALIDLLKNELGISLSQPHCIEVSLWSHPNSKPKLECKVSVFTDAGQCVQGYGASFGIAYEEVRVKMRPKSLTLEPTDKVKVVHTSE